MTTDQATQSPREIELFSEVGGSPRIFKLEGTDGIGIEVGGKVCIKPLADWHSLGFHQSESRALKPGSFKDNSFIDGAQATVTDWGSIPKDADSERAAICKWLRTGGGLACDLADKIEAGEHEQYR